MSQHISKKREAFAKANIERKLALIDEFISLDNYADVMPGGNSGVRKIKFSLNWFCSWESEDLKVSKTSKGSALLKRRGELHSVVMNKLAEAMTYSDGRSKTTIKSGFKEQIKVLEKKLEELESFKQGLVDQNRKLLIEIETLNDQLQNERAQRNDNASVRYIR